jgi:hypothetical protein
MKQLKQEHSKHTTNNTEHVQGDTKQQGGSLFHLLRCNSHRQRPTSIVTDKMKTIAGETVDIPRTSTTLRIKQNRNAR